MPNSGDLPGGGGSGGAPGGVVVLLATYNGAAYLRQQIDSILAQTGVPGLRVLARDDGSQDETAAILDSYARESPARFAVVPTQVPSGSAQANFALLLRAALAAGTTPAGPQFFAFADQDDVWLPGKLRDSVAALVRLGAANPAGTPLLAFSDLRVVGEQLELRSDSFWRTAGIRPAGIHRLPRLLIQNVVTGCTAVINRPLAALAADMPQDAAMHDWWIALLACSLGAAVPLHEPTVLYRQHAANVLGAPPPPPGGMPRFRQHGERAKAWQLAQRQARALLRQHGEAMAVGRRRIVEAFLACDSAPDGFARCADYVRGGFFQVGLRRNLALLWYLWDRDNASSKPYAPEP